ncbi:ABC transporter substrate-binding protein [Scopulibacillus cellulosilyticus]|uniref:ABC transporter substrate-binding protein n=1 Tax=Scopulibacillus cellulosilyticus TaxID=2665665 RepID=A0ABW2Q0L6_9BACL
MKKLISVFTALILIFFLAGCQSSEETTTDSKRTNGVTVIRMMTLSDWNSSLKKIVAQFEKENPTIKVNLETYPYEQLFENTEVKLGSKSRTYDIITVDGPLVANYSVKDYLEPLNHYISPKEQRKAWIDSSIKEGTYKGKLMAAPMNTSTQVLFYNKDIFSKRGVKPPEFNIKKRWTWDQVVQAAKKLTYDTNGNRYPDVFGFSFEQVGRAYQNLALSDSLGANVISKDGLTTDGYLNSSKSVQAARFYYDLFNKWKVSPKITANESKEYFKTGKIAMFIGGTWNIKEFSDAKVNFGVAPHPYFKGHKVATPTGSWHLGISKFSTKKEAAAKFIRFLTIGKGAKMWFDIYQNVPDNRNLLQAINRDPSYDSFPKNVYRLASYEVQHTASPRPITPGYLEFENLYDRTFDDIKNGANPKNALDQSSYKIDRLLEKYRHVVK